MESKLILPDSNGVPNLEIRRMQRALDEERSNRGIHSQTANELAKALDALRKLSDNGEIRALLVVGLLTKSAYTTALPDIGPQGKGLFACPRDRQLAMELAAASHAFLDLVMSSQFPPPPDKPAS